MAKITDKEILYVLGRSGMLMNLEWVCEELGIQRGRGGRYSRTAAAKYTAISAQLQRLKRAGSVEYVKGSGSGWRVPKAAKRRATESVVAEQSRHDVAASVARHAEIEVDVDLVVGPEPEQGVEVELAEQCSRCGRPESPTCCSDPVPADIAPLFDAMADQLRTGEMRGRTPDEIDDEVERRMLREIAHAPPREPPADSQPPRSWPPNTGTPGIEPDERFDDGGES
jgi:hypothetical protein